MRLIDADKLLAYITGEDNKRSDSMQWERYAKIIENQPTAYDVDKVVGRLSCENCADCLLEENCTANFGDGFMEKIREIVKAGGVNE